MNYLLVFEFITLAFSIIMVICSFMSMLIDSELRASAIAAGIIGMFAVLPLKFIIYPFFEFVLKINLHSFISDSENFWLRLCTSIVMVGIIEETAKSAASLAGAGWIGTLRRPNAIFAASLSASIGFSIVESIDYVYFFGPKVLWLRIFISTSSHVLFSGLAGWTTAIALCSPTNSDKKSAAWGGYSLFLTGLLGASSLHGIFNIVASNMRIVEAIPILAAIMPFGMILLYYATMNTILLDHRINQAHIKVQNETTPTF